jgi:hypothetical protein
VKIDLKDMGFSHALIIGNSEKRLFEEGFFHCFFIYKANVI